MLDEFEKVEGIDDGVVAIPILTSYSSSSSSPLSIFLAFELN